MGNMQIQDTFTPYYKAAVQALPPHKTTQVPHDGLDLKARSNDDRRASSDAVARLTRCRDRLARLLSKAAARH